MSDFFVGLQIKAEAVTSFLSYFKALHEYMSLGLNSTPDKCSIDRAAPAVLS